MALICYMADDAPGMVIRPARDPRTLGFISDDSYPTSLLWAGELKPSSELTIHTDRNGNDWLVAEIAKAALYVGPGVGEFATMMRQVRAIEKMMS